VFGTVPATATALTAFSVTVTAQDADGNTATAYTAPVTIGVTSGLASGPAPATLGGSSSVAAVAGVATFSALTLDKAGSYTLVASSGTLTNAMSGTVAVSPGAASKLAFTTGPVSIVAGAAMPAVVVTVRDAADNVAIGFTGPVTLALANNPVDGTLAGSTKVSAVAGVATFGGLSIDRSGTGYTMFVSAGGASSVTSTPFNIVIGTPSACFVVSGGNQSAGSSTLLSPIVIGVQDAGGNAVPSLVLGATVTQGGGTVASATATTNASGRASFAWTTGATGGQTLRVSCGAAGSITVSATASGEPVSYIYLSFPGTIQAGNTIQLPATTYGSNENLLTGRVVTWTSSNTAVATVSGTGLVTGVAPGSATITATSEGKNNSRTVTVQPAFVVGTNLVFATVSTSAVTVYFSPAG
jgi:hypothetical protein